MRVIDEIHDVLPKMSIDELRLLRDDIERRGVILNPLLTATINNEEVLVDGRTRWLIARDLNLEYKTQNIGEMTIEEAKLWVMKHQLGRRNLTDYARAEVVLKMKDLLAAQAKERMLSGKRVEPDPTSNLTGGKKGEVRDELASHAGVSAGTMHKVEKIAEMADEQTKQDLRDGKKSIHAAYQELVKPPDYVEEEGVSCPFCGDTDCNRFVLSFKHMTLTGYICPDCANEKFIRPYKEVVGS